MPAQVDLGATKAGEAGAEAGGAAAAAGAEGKERRRQALWPPLTGMLLHGCLRTPWAPLQVKGASLDPLKIFRSVEFVKGAAPGEGGLSAQARCQMLGKGPARARWRCDRRATTWAL